MAPDGVPVISAVNQIAWALGFVEKEALFQMSLSAKLWSKTDKKVLFIYWISYAL